MKFFTASIVIGPLMLIGASPAAAGQWTLSPGPAAPLWLVAGSDTATDRDAYLQRARIEMQEWQQKLHDFGEKSEAKGKEAANAAKEDLKKAWAKTEAASHKLQTASAEGWASARASFDKATRELSEAWHKVHPEDE
jgi:hypothetical protein